MTWKRTYEILLGLGLLLIGLAFFFPLATASVLAVPGILMAIGASVELLLLRRKTKTQPSMRPMPTVVRVDEIKQGTTKKETPIAFSPPPQQRTSWFARIFPKKKQPSQEKKQKQPEEIKVIERQEEQKITILRRYIHDSLEAGYPKEKILEAAVQSHWPQEMINQILAEMIGKRVKKKLIVFGSLCVVSILALVILALQGLFILPYWFEIAEEATKLFYVGVVVLIAGVAGLMFMRLRKVLKKKQIEYRIQESSHVEEIRDALKKFEGGYETDIDRFYALVAQKKKVTITAVAQAFKISEETAEEWAKILMDQNLVDVHYPTVGDPEVIWKSSKTTKSE